MLRLENVNFFRAFGEGVEKIPSSSSKRVKYAVSLTAFRSVAITPFSFPFNNVLRIREALKLQTLPYATAGEMKLFPFIIEKTSRASSGVAVYTPSGELENYPVPSTQMENRVWPAPLVLVSKVGGEGVTFWLDEENICSMLWRGGIPILYRWKSRADATSDTELAWYERYCKSRGEEVGEVFVMDATIPPELAKIPDIAKESLALCPWIGDVNMSQSALDSAVVLERLVQSLSKVASWILIMGLLILVGNGLRYYEARRNTNEFRRRAVELYRSAFEPTRTGAIPDPLGLARSAVHELRAGPTDGRSISDMFYDLGAIFEQNPGMEGITLDVTRYNPEGVNYTGSAPNMEMAQEFRRAWAEKAYSAQLGSLSSIPGGSGYRFELYVRW